MNATNSHIRTNVRKMNTMALARKFEREFGWAPFNAWEERQMMMASLTVWLINKAAGMTLAQSREVALLTNVRSTLAATEKLVNQVKVEPTAVDETGHLPAEANLVQWFGARLEIITTVKPAKINTAKKTSKQGRGRFADELVRTIRHLRNELKMTYKEISEATGVSDNMCCAIATGISYKDVL